jgi:hypothetical protein
MEVFYQLKMFCITKLPPGEVKGYAVCIPLSLSLLWWNFNSVGAADKPEKKITTCGGRLGCRCALENRMCLEQRNVHYAAGCKLGDRI